MEQIIFKGKVIGVINRTNYISHRKPEHFMIKYGCFGISLSIINMLKSKGVKDVKIVYHKVKGGEEVYSIPLAMYLESKNTHNDDGDEQRFVRVKSLRFLRDKETKEQQELKI